MSVLSNLEVAIQTTETDVVNFFMNLKSEAQIVEQDFIKVLQWCQAHGEEIATDVAGLLGVIVAAGVGIPAPVLAASTALNTAVAAVNAAIAAQQAQQAAGGGVGTQSVAALAAGYQSLKTAQIASSQAQSHVVATATAPAKPTS